MATVTIMPMPQWIRDLPPRLRAQHPPIFDGVDITPEDRELARALFEELDAVSQTWYRSSMGFAPASPDAIAVQRSDEKP